MLTIGNGGNGGVGWTGNGASVGCIMDLSICDGRTQMPSFFSSKILDLMI